MGYWRNASATADRSAFLCSENVRPDAEESYFFDLRGSGVRAVEDTPGFVDWRETCRLLMEAGAEFKRVDAVVDNIGGEISFAKVRDAVADGRCLRKGYAWQEISKHTRAGIEQTLYVGARTSDVMLRMYDKGLQLGEERSWMRFEFELKRERADQWVRLFVEDGWDLAYSALRGFIDFRDRVEDTNRSRWPVSEWWADLISQSRMVLRSVKEVRRSIERTVAFLKRQVSKPLARVVHCFDGDVTLVYEMIEDGMRRFNRQDQDQIRHYRRSVMGAVYA
jgi:phage replication initiation protein